MAVRAFHLGQREGEAVKKKLEVLAKKSIRQKAKILGDENMKTDLFGKNSLEANGVRVIREGLAVAKFGVMLGANVHSIGTGPFKFEAIEADGELSKEEYLSKPFRILSAAVTPYRFFDFSKENVLKTATPLFDGLTVYANHNADVNAWKGFTKSTTWDEKNDPPGINALMVIDRTVDARLARGVETGALKSASVTVWFEFERSHPELKYFFDHLGEEVDGEIVRFVVTEIIRAAEVSIVWEGEDPYAKALSASLTASGEDKQIETTQQKGGSVAFTKAFLSFLGFGTDEVAESEVEAKVTEKIEALETKVTELKPDAEVGKKHLEKTRERAATLYKTLKGDGANQSYIDNVILKADLETAEALVEEYQGGVEEAVPLSCPKCGEKLSRRSSQAEGKQDAGEKSIEDYKV